MLQTTYHSPLGPLTLLADEAALKGVWFLEQAHYGAAYPLEQISFGNNSILQESKKWLHAYFKGQEPNTTIPLAPNTSPFQALVLEQLLSIPYGQTTTYKEIAHAIKKQTGLPSSPRTVGRSVATNPISILIPCHRVLASDGSLNGYAGGLNRKAALLDLEKKNATYTNLISKSEYSSQFKI